MKRSQQSRSVHYALIAAVILLSLVFASIAYLVPAEPAPQGQAIAGWPILVVDDDPPVKPPGAGTNGFVWGG